MRILIVEDDQDTLRFIAKGLEEAGHAVMLASDGTEGLYHAAGGGFDVVVVAQ